MCSGRGGRGSLLLNPLGQSLNNGNSWFTEGLDLSTEVSQPGYEGDMSFLAFSCFYREIAVRAVFSYNVL